MGVKFGMEEGTEGSPPPCQISPPSVQRVALRGEKPQNWPLSKLNTGRFALRAMLPVTNFVERFTFCDFFFKINSGSFSGVDFCAFISLEIKG